MSEDLHNKLYKKFSDEQEKYRSWLRTQAPDAILDHAYEYSIREDIVLALAYHELSPAQIRTLLALPNPLAVVYQEYDKRDCGYMDDIRDCIDTVSER